MKKLQIGVIIGGAKAQQHVNLSHSNDLSQALQELGHSVVTYNLGEATALQNILDDRARGRLDIIFNNAAGKLGGDGTVEGLLELAHIPFVGSDTHATACAFDKVTSKRLVSAVGVPVAPSFIVSESAYDLATVQAQATALGFPLVVKAVRGSDSLGVSLVEKPKDIKKALLEAFKHDSTVIIEMFIDRSADVTCMVLGEGKHAEALNPLESVFDAKIYTSDLEDSTILRKPQIGSQLYAAIQNYAVEAHRALGCRDYSRTDFLIDKIGNVYFLEINAHAGLGKGGCTDVICNDSRGWSYLEMVENILAIACKRAGVTK